MNFIINLYNFDNLGGTSANRTSSFAFGLHKISRPQGRLTSPMGNCYNFNAAPMSGSPSKS